MTPSPYLRFSSYTKGFSIQGLSNFENLPPALPKIVYHLSGPSQQSESGGAKQQIVLKVQERKAHGKYK